MSFDEQVRNLAPISLEAPKALGGVIEDTSKVLEASRDRASELSSHFESTNSKIAAVAEDIGDLQIELSAMVEQISTALEHARQTAREMLTESEKEIEALRGEVQSVVGNFQNATKTIEAERYHCAAARESIESALSSLASKGTGEQQRVTGEFQSSVQRLEQFGQKATELHGQCQGSAKTVLQQMEENRNSLVERQGEAKQGCETRFTDLDTAVQELLESVVTSGANDLLNTTRETVESSLKEIVDQGVDELRTKIDEIIATITEADEDTSALREHLEPLIEELKDLVDPLKQCIKSVQEFADRILPG